MSSLRVRAHAPGRVNLIGGHVDYAGGMVLPMAIQLGTTVVAQRGHDRVALRSVSEDEPAVLALEPVDPTTVTPRWASYVAAVLAELASREGIVGEVTTTIPIGTGLSSSAALEVAVALALLGPDAMEGLDRVRLAQQCQRAELAASGVPCGIMDQLASLCGAEGQALLLDCTTLVTRLVPVPDDVAFVVIDSGQPRTLAGSGYAQRRAEVEAAAAVLGPLPGLDVAVLDGLEDPILRRRARHVITEHRRVLQFVDALAAGDRDGAGALMRESHESLRHDHEVTTDVLDALVEDLCARPGVFGARLTGGGWGGGVIAMTEPGALQEGWTVRPSAGATVEAL